MGDPTMPMPSAPVPPESGVRSSRRRLFIWGGVALAFIVVVGVVAGAGASATSKARKERDALQSQLSDTQAKLVTEQSTNASLTNNLNTAKADTAQAEHKMRVAQADAKNAEHQALKDARAALATQQAAVNAQAATVRQQQAAVTAAQGELNANSVGDGIYAIGTDVQPGTYYTAGGSTCYYAILNSTDTNDIATNDLGGGPKVVDLPAGKYFETKDCGSWVKR